MCQLIKKPTSYLSTYTITRSYKEDAHIARTMQFATKQLLPSQQNIKITEVENKIVIAVFRTVE